ncbi:SDR family NAD(P)-dependent oxidoreductase [Nonomuraea sp. SBT364]|uniref:SDR family NAD(P)-dependent oxidoreductase n=1 Tax=Nonomuraea sp. SBT364 TaxID=1580530 RepID=UPI00066E9CC9|nr:SDR family NAD(P)-dependent oxidoreductase [Nonomuraea sp. SBT364]
MGEALRGRIAVVTGAGRSAGAAAARALSRAGAGVVLAARDGRALEELAAGIGAAGGHVVAVPTDLASPVSVRRLVEQTLGAFGRLDAAFNHSRAALAMRYELPPMRRAGRGRIVNLATGPRVIELTRAAARDLAGSGVLVNAVAGPYGSVEELADAVVWLCSDAASLGAGETLRIGSGLEGVPAAG